MRRSLATGTGDLRIVNFGVGVLLGSNGENYIVVNYRANSSVNKVWILWEAQDGFFSPRLKNSNARSINRDAGTH